MKRRLQGLLPLSQRLHRIRNKLALSNGLLTIISEVGVDGSEVIRQRGSLEVSTQPHPGDKSQNVISIHLQRIQVFLRAESKKQIDSTSIGTGSRSSMPLKNKLSGNCPHSISTQPGLQGGLDALLMSRNRARRKKSILGSCSRGCSTESLRNNSS